MFDPTHVTSYLEHWVVFISLGHGETSHVFPLAFLPLYHVFPPLHLWTLLVLDLFCLGFEWVMVWNVPYSDGDSGLERVNSCPWYYHWEFTVFVMILWFSLGSWFLYMVFLSHTWFIVHVFCGESGFGELGSSIYWMIYTLYWSLFNEARKCYRIVNSTMRY